MTTISVVAETNDTFRVEVHAHDTVTSHTVTIPTGFPTTVGCANVAPEQLIRSSFEFLLEHEPATSILRRFSLDQIGDYFADYPAEIGRRLQQLS